MKLNRTEKIVICCTMAIGIMFLMEMRKDAESQNLSMKAMCRANMIAAEVSKLDKGIAVDLYRFTGGRTAIEMQNLPQCKDVFQ